MPRLTVEILEDRRVLSAVPGAVPAFLGLEQLLVIQAVAEAAPPDSDLSPLVSGAEAGASAVRPPDRGEPQAQGVLDIPARPGLSESFAPDSAHPVPGAPAPITPLTAVEDDRALSESFVQVRELLTRHPGAVFLPGEPPPPPPPGAEPLEPGAPDWLELRGLALDYFLRSGDLMVDAAALRKNAEELPGPALLTPDLADAVLPLTAAALPGLPAPARAADYRPGVVSPNPGLAALESSAVVAPAPGGSSDGEAGTATGRSLGIKADPGPAGPTWLDAAAADGAGGALGSFPETDHLACFRPEPTPTLDAALARFLDQVDALGHRAGQILRCPGVPFWMVSLAAAAAALEIVRRRRRLPARLAWAAPTADTTLTWMTAPPEPGAGTDF